MKRIVAVVTGLVLALLLMSPTVEADCGVGVTSRTGDGTWVGDTWKVSIYPNEEKSTTLVLHNLCDDPLVVNIQLDLPNDSNLTFEVDKTGFVMPNDSYANVTLTVKASGSAVPGLYTTESLVTIGSEPVPTPTPVTTPWIKTGPGMAVLISGIVLLGIVLFLIVRWLDRPRKKGG